ncbi:hypothetical protein PF005_g4189 [Phytophthora fragariae]|uniref:TRP C-terminal domain-containing protein n=1 Tax=Phytophthora fragariae TaxID=53985 RepID=A0A6A3KMJ9_9STRA|nr:hypothetical protein PF003_g36196 [Phytophthora fragariae]KAE8942244.1 hypothetical protein PF009_g7993 [Phytophthora fragariae]KAE9008480.1 hypothetical protein PF011_g10692 [Phytophthora fragariae]KAE9106852.1 hypothetical protein PF007_g13253 [Phytophthora fragariae]KAE9109820.1 hypothetical protein PF010_g11396 [Phytophthora fragariae]
MRVYSAAIAAAAALCVASAQTSTATTTTTSTATTSTVSTSSGSGNSITTSAGSVSCVFRYSMPTATNLPSGVSTSTSTTSSGSNGNGGDTKQTDGSNAMSGSVGDGSADTPGTVGVGSDSSSGSKTQSSTNGSKTDTSGNTSSTGSGSSTSTTPTSTTKTPTSTTKTPTATTKTPSATTKTPSATTQTPSTSITDGSSTSTSTETTAPSTTTGSTDGGRRLMGEAGEATTLAGTTVDTAGMTGAVSAESSAATGSTTTTTATTAPTATTATPSSTTKTPSSTTKTPSATTATPTGSTSNTTTTTKTPSTTTTTTGSSSMTGSAGVVGSTTGSTTIEFSCDSTFYGAWAKMGLTCDGTELDVQSAAASTECLIYSGTSSGSEISDLATCMSVCRFPACNNGTWDYTSAEGISSDVYAGLDFITLMGYAGTQAAEAVADAVQHPFSNLTFAATTECEYTSDSSFSACQCAGVTSTTSSASTIGTSTTANSEYSVPVNKGLEDSDHWSDGTKKSTVDKAGIASTTIGSSAATVSIVAGGVMSVASGIVGGTSAGVASGVSAAASVGITMAAVDICQFSIMLNQMNVDARPRFMENMGKKMSPAAFTFLPFGKVNSSSSDDGDSSNSTSRRLVTGSSSSGSSSSGSGSTSSTTGVQGMEKYASLIGVQADMLFYLAVAGIACMVGCLFGLYALAMGVCYFVVDDFATFSQKWLDKAIGVLMMILILSEYVVGATGMYEICYCIDHKTMGVSFFLAIVTLLCLAFGTILYGVHVIKNNEDELRDLGTKDHFDKKFHARYGPLYDEHSFEGRFFFAPKLLLALLTGMTTGMIWIQGLWQIVVLIAFHIAFLLYLEIKQPYPTAFVQKTSSFVIIIKISALFLSFFLLSSATSFTESIPDDLREGVAFAIVGLQVLVLVCLMIRQVYIFYRTWKLKRDGGADDKTVTVQTANAREGSEAFFALGGEPQYYNNNSSNQPRVNSLAVLGDDATPRMQDPRHYAQETPANYSHGNRLRGLQPQGRHMQRTHTVVQHEGHHRNNEVDL